jgi:uncharacterized membrane protein
MSTDGSDDIRSFKRGYAVHMRTLSFKLANAVGPYRGREGRLHHPGLALVGIVLVAAVITLAILLYRSRNHTPAVAGVPGTPPGGWSPAIAAETILSERFARGDLSVEEFVAARAALRAE